MDIFEEKSRFSSSRNKISCGRPPAEYYLIRVENFPDLIAEDLDEWIFMLKNEEVKEEFQSKNIQLAAEKLNVLKMSPEEKKKYEHYLMNLASEQDIIATAKEEGGDVARGGITHHFVRNIGEGTDWIRKLLKRRE